MPISSSGTKVHVLQISGGAAGDGKQAGLGAHPDQEGPHRLIPQSCIGSGTIDCKATHAWGRPFIPFPLTLSGSKRQFMYGGNRQEVYGRQRQ